MMHNPAVDISVEQPRRGCEIDVQVDDACATMLDTVELDTSQINVSLRLAIETTLQQQEISDAAVTIVITTDEKMQQLNRDHRGVDTVTDVLSFSNHETLDADPLEEQTLNDQTSTDRTPNDQTLSAQPLIPQFILPEELTAEQALYLGDIVIAYPYVAHQADKFGRTLLAELQLLAIHGTLHLLGFNHGTPSEEAQMWSHQDSALIALGLAPTDVERSN